MKKPSQERATDGVSCLAGLDLGPLWWHPKIKPKDQARSDKLSDEQPDVKSLSFEQAMKALEEVVSQLEHGDVALDRSIALYERGAELKARCSKLLKEAEERVEKITLGADGAPQGTTPADGL